MDDLEMGSLLTPVPRARARGEKMELWGHINQETKASVSVTVEDTISVSELRNVLVIQYLKTLCDARCLVIRATPTGDSLEPRQYLWQAPMFDSEEEPVEIYIDVTEPPDGPELPSTKCNVLSIVFYVWLASIVYLWWVIKHGEHVPPKLEGFVQIFWILPAIGLLMWVVIEGPELTPCCACLRQARTCLINSHICNWPFLFLDCSDSKKKKFFFRARTKEKHLKNRRVFFQISFTVVSWVVLGFADIRSFALAGYFIGSSVLEIVTLLVGLCLLRPNWWRGPEYQPEDLVP